MDQGPAQPRVCVPANISAHCLRGGVRSTALPLRSYPRGKVLLSNSSVFPGSFLTRAKEVGDRAQLPFRRSSQRLAEFIADATALIKHNQRPAAGRAAAPSRRLSRGPSGCMHRPAGGSHSARGCGGTAVTLKGRGRMGAEGVNEGMLSLAAFPASVCLSWDCPVLG